MSAYSTVFDEGPLAGVPVFMPRRYDEISDGTGKYVWNEKREGYIWVPKGRIEDAKEKSES